MAVTLKDLAKSLNLSVSTVNAALYNRADISSATRRRVQDLARAMNYHPNLVARSLKLKKTFVLGVVVPDLSRFFFAEITKGADAIASAHGYNIVLCNTEEDLARERAQIATLISKRVDGLIVASAHPAESKGTPEHLTRSGIPLVLVDRFFPGANFVGNDDDMIGYLATKHLIEQGYRRIAHLSVPTVLTGKRRIGGYLKALREFGIEMRPEYIREAQFYDESTGYRAAKRLLQTPPYPDAFFAASDPIAVGALEALRKSGRRVPEDAGVIGVGHHYYDRYLRVPLSTVDQNCIEMGQRAASVLLDLIEKPRDRKKPRVILVDPKLIVRESSRRTSNVSKSISVKGIAADSIATTVSQD
jgi:LacI family transcriptional regulator